MSKEKTLNLSEAALEILKHNKDAKLPEGEKFGEGKKLNDTVNKHADKIGNANFAEYDLDDVPSATPPGQTPPVGSEKWGEASANDKLVAKELKASPAEQLAKFSTPKQFPPKGVNEDEEFDGEEYEVNEDIFLRSSLEC